MSEAAHIVVSKLPTPPRERISNAEGRRRGKIRRYRRPRAAYPDPWPVNFDAPQFPHPPGQWPEPLRRAWRLWSELWDFAAAGLEAETAGALWGVYDALRRYGVRFDPVFSAAFENLRERTARADDELDDPDNDVSYDDGQDGHNAGIPGPPIDLADARATGWYVLPVKTGEVS